MDSAPVHVFVQLIEAPVAALDEVNAHAADHVLERLDVHGEALHRVGEGRIQDVVWLALPDVLQPILPPVQSLQPPQSFNHVFLL